MENIQLLVLISLFASAVTAGYSRERPGTASPQAQGGDSNMVVSPSTSPTASAPAPSPVTYPSPSDIASLLGAGLYPDYVSRYYGPTAVPLVLPDGHIADTATVAAARAAHLAALDRAKALWYGPRDDGSYNPYKYGDYAYNYNTLLRNTLSGQLGAINPNLIPTYLQNIASKPYYGPMDPSLGIPKGYVAEAKAAAMAKEAQSKALEKARAEAFLNGNLFPYASFYPSYLQSALNATSFNPLATLLGLSYSGLQGPLNRPYFGPLATPNVLTSGYLADTPEVAAARAAHLSSLLRAKALWDAKRAGDVIRYGGYPQVYNNYLQNFLNGSYVDSLSVSKDLSTLLQGPFTTPYSGPLTNPSGLHSNYLADISAAAQAAHLSTLARTQAEAALWRPHNAYKRSN